MTATTTLIVMGVSGVGKTTVATALADRTGWPYTEGDDLHPEANRAKMAAGHPLDDDDRWPWLQKIADWIGEQERAGRSTVITCSALRRRYRDLLRDGHPSVHFVHLAADEQVLRDRVQSRHHEYMPATLLDSQLADLEPPADDEPAITVDASAPVEEIVTAVLDETDPARTVDTT
ncbi:gluconokinase [Pseudonocardia sediminis]|uniref:Gluconokinase n=1 Tax=Pseudonocardia sediminis TaxID=1397368 RepID=A0A4Q7UW48_PSEST|nr:gluconokinase [Pseudonocardia sediminis]RZT86162.1 gluconokinase [Pseudonocardia sediminis]